MNLPNHVDHPPQFTCLEWCAGYAGIHLGLSRVIPNLRTLAFGEIEAYACANLVAKMEAGYLDPAPVWTDIKTFPCGPFRDRVDILVAGYPCQPFSAAGLRLGAEDPRHLWPHILAALPVLRPRLCFFENVEGHVSLGLSTVLSDLEEAGYTTTWGIFSAAEIGASHIRKRVFILGQLVHGGRAVRRPGLTAGRNEDGGNSDPARRQESANEAAPAGQGLADRDPQREQQPGGLVGEKWRWLEHRCARLADPAQQQQREPDDAPRAEPRQDPRADAGGGGGRILNTAVIAAREGESNLRLRTEDGAAGRELLDHPLPGLRRIQRVGDVPDEWQRVIFAADCPSDDADRELLTCAGCGGDYGECPCPCPGPSQDDLYEYREHGGTLYARELAHAGQPGCEGREQRASLHGDGHGQEAHGPVAELCGLRDVAELPDTPPRPGDLDAWRSVLALDPSLEPALRRVAHGDSNRVDRLRLCGNGVVPGVVAKAFVTLFHELNPA